MGAWAKETILRYLREGDSEERFLDLVDVAYRSLYAAQTRSGDVRARTRPQLSRATIAEWLTFLAADSKSRPIVRAISEGKRLDFDDVEELLQRGWAHWVPGLAAWVKEETD